MGKLCHPFAQVGFHGSDAARFEIVIQLRLFTDHGFGFDDEVNTLLLAKVINIGVGILCCARLVDDGTGCLGLSFELRQHLWLVINRIVLSGAQL